MEFTVIGKSVPRIDAAEKVTGKAVFCDDIKLPGMLLSRVLRSPYPHARIKSIDTAEAKRLPGVRCVITGNDVPQKRFGAIVFDQSVLAIEDEVRYAGEPVAAVAADTVEAAEEALGLIKVEYQELPAVFDPEQAMSTNPPVVVHPNLFKYVRGRAFGGPRFDPDRPNVFFHMKIRKGDVDKGFQEADLVMENRFKTSRVQHCPLEPQDAIAQPMPDGGLTLWVGRQNIWGLDETIGELYDIKPSKIRIIQPYVGGGFGLKNRIALEPIVVALALKTGRPVKMVFTREEVFIHGGNDVPMIVNIKDGVKKDGTLIARQIKAVLKAGAYEYNVALATRISSFRVGGIYRTPNLKWDSYGVYTNELPSSGFRAPGNNPTVWAIESQMDMLAEKLDIDPVEFRRKNLLYEGEPNGMGEPVISFGAPVCLDKVGEMIKSRIKPQGYGPWQIGRGIALCDKHSLAPTVAMARVKISSDGGIIVYHSADEIGQGCNTMAAQVAAEEFAVPVETVKMVFTDTFITPYFSGGATSSRVTFSLGNAVILACRAAKKKLLARAAEKLGVPLDELDTRQGEVYVKGTPSKKLRISELFQGYRGDRPGGYGSWTRGGEIVGEDTWVQDHTPEDPDTGQINPVAAAQGKRLNSSYCYMGRYVEVAVNVETGEVRLLWSGNAIDMGQPINPKMCEQQLEGGLSMSLGYTLMEEIQVKNGLVLNPNFTDYRIPTALEMPVIDNVKLTIVPVPHKDGPFGAKGGFGEGAMLGIQSAIGNAIYDAVGVRVKDLPITPERLLQALHESQKRS